MCVTRQNCWCQCSHFIEKNMRPFRYKRILEPKKQQQTTNKQRKPNKQTTKTNHQKSLPLVIAPKPKKNNNQKSQTLHFFLVTKKIGHLETPQR